MPASKKNRVNTAASAPEIDQLGILAGGGGLPFRLVDACEEKGIQPFIVAFEGQADPSLTAGHQHMWARMGAAGKVMNTLKSHNIRDIVLIGSIRRPTLAELTPDLKATEFFARIGWKALGDNDLLGALRKTLEEEGFRVHGVHKFAEDLLMDEGPIGKYRPKKGDWVDIERAVEVSIVLGTLDIGQSVIVQEGIVLGVEAIEGTDELMKRCKGLKRKGRGGVLVKTCKPQQDRDLDLPTIGPETVRNAVALGLSGIALHAGESLVIDSEDVVKLADKHKMFVIGIDPVDYIS